VEIKTEMRSSSKLVGGKYLLVSSNLVTYKLKEPSPVALKMTENLRQTTQSLSALCN